METNRLFVAVDLSATAIAKIQSLQSALIATLGRRVFRWIPAANLHVTLNFLGETSVASVRSISQSLDQVSLSSTPFTLRLQGLGCFPNAQKARVLWLGMENAEQLTELAAKVRAVSPVKGDEKPFSPHITLARVCDSMQPEDLVKLTEVLKLYQHAEIATSGVQNLVLYRSMLNTKASIYTHLHIAPFAR